ncbi:hypothetical protein C7M84_020397 [Penaeus vannamei]|uniref:Uncharacterized protein n=1 Tax=Penaeus vannamei TaxID=6689 RepID=A0A3R7QAK0_PENVA|nr:hypothetical protein C7M84_020397 [Penaeus vannamei]
MNPATAHLTSKSSGCTRRPGMKDISHSEDVGPRTKTCGESGEGSGGEQRNRGTNSVWREGQNTAKPPLVTDEVNENGNEVPITRSRMCSEDTRGRERDGHWPDEIIVIIQTLAQQLRAFAPGENVVTEGRVEESIHQDNKLVVSPRLRTKFRERKRRIGEGITTGRAIRHRFRFRRSRTDSTATIAFPIQEVRWKEHHSLPDLGRFEERRHPPFPIPSTETHRGPDPRMPVRTPPPSSVGRGRLVPGCLEEISATCRRRRTVGEVVLQYLSRTQMCFSHRPGVSFLPLRGLPGMAAEETEERRPEEGPVHCRRLRGGPCFFGRPSTPIGSSRREEEGNKFLRLPEFEDGTTRLSSRRSSAPQGFNRVEDDATQVQ